jgi:hypothetical protein
MSGGRPQLGPEQQCQDNAGPCYDIHVVQAPDSGELAPPGYYMLFILDANRVPSVGKIVKLDPAADADCAAQANCARRLP